jgi:RNA polymerase sigma-70 factor (ECF subfamily)
MQAFGELVARYAPQARRLARSMVGEADGDDAAQDGFLSALKYIGRFDTDRPFGPWLMRIVTNAAADRRRRERVRTTFALSPALPAREPGPDSETDRRRLVAALEDALQELPERHRAAVVLFDVEGYSHGEIAEILQIPEGTVRSNVFHARRALRKALAPWRGWKEELV